ncbi:hypothetical protein TNCV_129531 [Trichonephila clavipes]|nr:hypothetical protein TNCV_129531 [Trichonephila clavipes]
MKRLGFVPKLYLSVLRIKRKPLMDRILKRYLNLAGHKRELFLDHLVTRGEKWIMNKYVFRKRAYVFKEDTPLSPSKAGHESVEGYVVLFGAFGAITGHMGRLQFSIPYLETHVELTVDFFMLVDGGS